MSHERLRQLERRWRETGIVEDEAAYHLERVRAGELTREQLSAAACLGSEAARLALGGTPEGQDPLRYWWLDQPTGPEARWSREVGRLGEVAGFRVGLALARAHLVAGHGVAETLESVEREFLDAIRQRGELPQVRDLPANASVLRPILWPQSVSLDKQPVSPEKRFWFMDCDPALARRILAEELVPWLLGYGDPVSVRARKP